MTGRKIKVAKIDAARRQVDTAIALWFGDGDAVAIHTLAAAAHEIIHALYKKRGLNDLLLDSDWIKDEYRKLWIDKIREAPNFFKHADRDPDRVLDFDPAVNDLHILFTLVGMNRLGEELNEIENIFLHRLGLEQPKILKDDRYARKLTPLALAELKATTRPVFLAGARLANSLHKTRAGRNQMGKRVGKLPTL